MLGVTITIVFAGATICGRDSCDVIDVSRLCTASSGVFSSLMMFSDASGRILIRVVPVSDVVASGVTIDVEALVSSGTGLRVGL